MTHIKTKKRLQNSQSNDQWSQECLRSVSDGRHFLTFGASLTSFLTVSVYLYRGCMTLWHISYISVGTDKMSHICGGCYSPCRPAGLNLVWRSMAEKVIRASDLGWQIQGCISTSETDTAFVSAEKSHRNVKKCVQSFSLTAHVDYQ